MEFTSSTGRGPGKMRKRELFASADSGSRLERHVRFLGNFNPLLLSRKMWSIRYASLARE